MKTPFLIPTSDPTIFELEVDNSAKELYETCARAAEYYTLQRRELDSERSALNFGGVVHKALVPRKLYLTGENPMPTWPLEQESIIVTEFSNRPAAIDDWRTADRAIQTIQLYNAHWPVDSEPFKLLKSTVELPFRILLGTANLDQDIPGIGYVSVVRIFWTGRIDGVIEYDHQILVLDHKTTSILGQNFYDDFLLSSQMQGYCWACRKLGFDAKGLLLDVLAIRKPTRTGVGNEFQRQRYFYAEEHLTEWERDMFQHVVDFLEHLCDGYFPKSTKWCMGKYGQCQYFPVCSQLPQHRQDLLNSAAYRDVTWSPLNGSTLARPTQAVPEAA